MKMIKTLCLVIFAFCLINSPDIIQASLFEGFGFSGTFESGYTDHDIGEETAELYERPYSSFESQVSLNADWKDFYAELRLRHMSYENPIHVKPDTREYESDIEIFKFALGYRHKYFNVVAGDFYKSLTRGIILHVQEDENLNLDRTIRGGNGIVTLGPVELDLFGGEIPWYLYKDNKGDETFEEFKINDRVFGGHISGKLPAGITLGASFTKTQLYDYAFERGEYVELREDILIGEVDLEISGLFGGMVDFYSEYSEMEWDDIDWNQQDTDPDWEYPFKNSSITDDGKAFYASLIAYLGNFTVLTEYIDYDQWNYRYSQPPTADRDDEEVDTVDVKGPRIRVDYFFDLGDANILLYLSASRFDNHSPKDSFGEVSRNRVDHIFEGIEVTWDRLYAHLTYGLKEEVTNDVTWRRFTSDVVFTLTDTQSLNGFYEYKYEEIIAGDSFTEETKHKSYLTYFWSPWLGFTLHYNEIINDSTYSNKTKEEWVAGEISITPISTVSLNVLYGQMPPGLICSGGQCRVIPEFEGVQASLTYRF